MHTASPIIKLPNDTRRGLYVAFRLTPDRMSRGAMLATCHRCTNIVGHYPLDSDGYEIVCLKCANDVPAIRRHIDEIAKERGE